MQLLINIKISIEIKLRLPDRSYIQNMVFLVDYHLLYYYTWNNLYNLVSVWNYFSKIILEIQFNEIIIGTIHYLQYYSSVFIPNKHYLYLLNTLPLTFSNHIHSLTTNHLYELKYWKTRQDLTSRAKLIKNQLTTRSHLEHRSRTFEDLINEQITDRFCRLTMMEMEFWVETQQSQWCPLIFIPFENMETEGNVNNIWRIATRNFRMIFKLKFVESIRIFRRPVQPYPLIKQF